LVIKVNPRRFRAAAAGSSLKFYFNCSLVFKSRLFLLPASGSRSYLTANQPETGP
jgi:hypothetical protein